MRRMHWFRGRREGGRVGEREYKHLSGGEGGRHKQCCSPEEGPPCLRLSETCLRLSETSAEDSSSKERNHDATNAYLNVACLCSVTCRVNGRGEGRR